LGWTTEIFD